MLEAKQEGRIVLITKWGVRHEDYDGEEITNDIGVLQLPRAVELNGEAVGPGEVRVELFLVKPLSCLHAVGRRIHQALQAGTRWPQLRGQDGHRVRLRQGRG